MFEMSFNFAVGVNSSAGGSRREPRYIDVKIDDHRLSADWPNTPYRCEDLRVPSRTVPQVDMHRRDGVTTIPDLAGRIDEFGVGPVGIPVSFAALTVPSIAERAGKLLCR